MNINNRYDKKNKPWAIIELNTVGGKADIFVFNDTFEKYNTLLEEDACVFIKGSPSNMEDTGDSLKIVSKDIYSLKDIRAKLSHYVNIMFDSYQKNEGILEKIIKLSKDSKGNCGVVFHMCAENGNVQKVRARKIGVNPSSKYIQDLRILCGERRVWIS